MNILKTAAARTKSEKDAQTSCKTLHFDDNFSWTVQNAKLSSEKEPFFSGRANQMGMFYNMLF